MLTAVMGAVIPIVLKEGLTEENIEKAVEFPVASGKKLGSRASRYLEERKQRMETPGGSASDGGIPAEVQEEYYRLCDDAAVRLLANALNHLLRDRYLTKFTTY